MKTKKQNDIIAELVFADDECPARRIVGAFSDEGEAIRTSLLVAKNVVFGETERDKSPALVLRGFAGAVWLHLHHLNVRGLAVKGKTIDLARSNNQYSEYVPNCDVCGLGDMAHLVPETESLPPDVQKALAPALQSLRNEIEARGLDTKDPHFHPFTNVRAVLAHRKKTLVWKRLRKAS